MKTRSSRLVLPIAFFGLLLVATASRSSAQDRYWIEFRDKGPTAFDSASDAYREAMSRLSPRAIARRKAEGKPVIAYEDLAIYAPYLDTLRHLGVLPKAAARWSTAISAELGALQRERIERLGCVKAIRPVGKSLLASTREQRSALFCGYDPVIDANGQSYQQLLRTNVLPLHAMGLDATSVRLGFLDTGFRWRTMSSLAHARVDREYDYVFHDSVTANEDRDVPDQDNHGSSTLAAAVGYDPGLHVGAAYQATLFLAKTEDLRSETPVEEDNWAQAIEDMERWGVDVTSTSLGYLTFDSGWTSHTYDDLNGHTTIAARAATRAGNLGVIVVNAMGNNGAQPFPFLNTPADADSILSVGALDELGNRADFSSIGPTSDGRMKPDICSPGVGVHTQAVDGHYDFFGGTSYATPLVSSACCLIRQAHPHASAESIRNAVRTTGSNAASPNNTLGWGEINTYAAALEVGDVMHQMGASYDKWIELCVGLASKFGVSQASVEYSSRTGGWLTQPLVRVTDSLIYSAQIAADPNTAVKYRYLLMNGAGQTTYLPDTGYYEITTSGSHDLVIDAYPNPAGNSATLLSNQPGTWELYDAAGRAARAGEVLFPGSQTIGMEGLADGAYFLILRSRSGEVATQKLFVLH